MLTGDDGIARTGESESDEEKSESSTFMSKEFGICFSSFS